jgi:Fungal protein kinase
LQGTAPFIALELLIHGSSHRVAHDLESLLYVLLFICTHLSGPFRKIRDPPLYGSDKKNLGQHPSGMKLWFEQNNLQALGLLKFSHMMSYFEKEIVKKFSPYFEPLQVYIIDFWKALIPERESTASDGRRVVHSTSTPKDVINVLKAALRDKNLIKQHASVPSVLGKRSAPGDLVGIGGWDPAEVSINPPTANPNLAPAPTKRRAKLLGKR